MGKLLERTDAGRRTAALTALALLAFAGNSILCRMALGGDAISPAGFTTVRLGAGAASLWLLVALRTLSLTVERSRPDDVYGPLWFRWAAWGGGGGRVGRRSFVAEWAALPVDERG